MPLKIMPAERPPYENLQFLHPDGGVMFLGNSKMARWYLENGLVRRLDDGSLQLLFTPRGPGAMGDGFLLTPKANVCAICGRTDDLSRHHIVPKRFARHFPARGRKDRSTHDVVPLCGADHSAFETLHSSELDRRLQEQGLLPPKVDHADLFHRRGRVFKSLNLLKRLSDGLIPGKHAATARAKYGLPQSPAEVAETERRLLEELRFLEPRKLVFEYSSEQKRLVELICRTHFLETMKPAFLPENWSVTYTRQCNLSP
jgi:5-methylcytosine-specific restriction endonuclease McrA